MSKYSGRVLPLAEIGDRQRFAVRALALVTIAGALAYVAYVAIHDAADGPVAFWDRFVWVGTIFGSAALCLIRAILVKRERLAWSLIGINLLVWAFGEAYWAAFLSTDPNAPYPSISDALILPSYPLLLAGIVVLVSDRARRFRQVTWLDGGLAAVTVAAFGCAFLLPPVIDALEGPALADIVTLAYPIGDTLVFGFLAAVLVLIGWRIDWSWGLLFASLAILPIADGVSSYQTATGTYYEGGVADLMFPISAALMGVAAWAPGSRERVLAAHGWRSAATPAFFALAAGGLLLWGYTGGLDELAVVFAGIALLGSGARLGITYRDNQRLFESTQRDSLTGLGNRSALILDTEDAIAEEPTAGVGVMVMFDLNGFKLYNDTFGHPAGDALLTRLSHRFAEAVGEQGKAYRIGGDEFCALLNCPRAEIQRTVSRCTASLSESGEGFEVDAARGYVVLEEGERTALEALQEADQRMYQDKAGSRSSARSQAHEVLMRVLRERQPELGAHVDGVTEAAIAVSKRLGIDPEQLDVITRAAALHDIGKMAIPDAVLQKPGPLDDEELRFIRDHTLVGDRILREAPALAPVADLVRASHERWDGDGYPDGLEGERIPLGARIIFVCDAFQAMTSDRPYAAAVSEIEAMAELRSCAGTQFDPTVVAAFCAELTSLPLPEGQQPSEQHRRV